MPVTMDFVGSILAGRSFMEFMATHWEKAPFHGPQVLIAPQDILDRQTFQESLAFLSRSGKDIPCIVEGLLARPLSGTEETKDPLSAAANAFHRRATILVPALQNHVPAIAALCRQFDNAFLSHGVPLKQATFANAYLTPSYSQGFGAHYDDHCVLVLQLEGSKHWVVAPPNQLLPVNRCMEVISDQTVADPLLEIELAQGDALYVPRGFVHFARCGDMASLHLTLGIRAVTWSDLLPRLANGLEAFRSSVMPVTTQGTSAVNFLRQCLAQSLAQAEPFDTLMDQLGESLSALPPLTSSGVDRFGTPPLSTDTVLGRAPNVLVMLASRDDRAVLHFPGGPLTLPAAMVDALAFISETERFSVSEIPDGRASFDKVELAGLLIRKGLVSVEDSGETGKSSSIPEERDHNAP